MVSVLKNTFHLAQIIKNSAAIMSSIYLSLFEEFVQHLKQARQQFLLLLKHIP